MVARRLALLLATLVPPILGLAAAAPAAAAGTRLSVVASTPVAHASDAPTATRIEVTFDAPVDAATVNASTFRVYGRWSGPVLGLLYVEGGNTAVFQPVRPFFVGEAVVAMLSAGVKGVGGGALTGGYHLEFMTRSALGTGNFTLVGQQSTRLPGEGLVQSYGIYAGDLNGDGAPDFSIPNETANDIRVFMNDGCGRYTGPDIIPMPFGATPSSNEGQDLNGDGVIDFATANIGSGTLSVLLGDGNGSYQAPVTYAAGANCRAVAMLDAEGDGDVDIVTAHRGGNDLGLHINDGTGAFAPVTKFEGGGSGETAAVATDADNDGIPDLIVGHYDSGSVSLLLGDGAAGFTLSDSTAVGIAPWMLAVGDVDGDGNVDFATCNAFSASASIVRGDGAGNLLPATNIPVGDFPIAIDLGDLDGDGDLDLVSSEINSAQWTCHTNDGAGNFIDPFTLASDSAGSCATLVDFDRDGFMDIVGIDEFSDIIFYYRQAVPSPAGVQTGICSARMRVDNMANSGGYGAQPAHEVPAGTVFHWGVTGPENEIFAIALGLPFEPGQSSPFGLFNLAAPSAVIAITALDDFGEATIPVPIAPDSATGITIGLQVFMNTPKGIRLTNPEAILLTP